MTINNPPNLSPLTDQSFIVQPVWSIFFTQVYKALTGTGGPLPLQSYVVSKLPPAAKNTTAMAYVPGDGPVYSDGQNWRTMAGVIIA